MKYNLLNLTLKLPLIRGIVLQKISAEDILHVVAHDHHITIDDLLGEDPQFQPARIRAAHLLLHGKKMTFREIGKLLNRHHSRIHRWRV